MEHLVPLLAKYKGIGVVYQNQQLGHIKEQYQSDFHYEQGSIVFWLG